MSFKRRIQWNRQPQYPVAIDRSNPFGVVSAFTPINQAGLTAIASPTDIVSPIGREKRFASNNSSLYRAATAQEKTPAASILWLGELLGTATIAASIGGTTYDAANTAPYVGMALKRNTAGNDNIFLTHNNTTTFNNLATAGISYTSGLYLIIGTAESGSQKLYVKNLSTGVVEKVTASVAGVISYTATSRVEVGDSLNARNPAAACALQALAGRAWTETEVYELLKNPWQIFPPLERNIYVEASGASDVTLSPNLFTDADTFYAATVTPGALTLSPSLFTDADTFYAATLAASIALAPALFTDADAFYAHTVAAGGVTLAPALFTDADTFYAAVVSADGAFQTLTADLFTDPDTFYAASLQSSITLTPALFTDADTFYAATLAASITLAPSLFVDADTFYAHTVTVGAVTLTPALFTDPDTFYAHAVSAASLQTLTASLFTDPDVFYGASISSGRQGGGWETYVAPRTRKAQKALGRYKKEYFELPYTEIVGRREEVESKVTLIQDEMYATPDPGLIARLKVAIETQKIKLQALRWVEEKKEAQRIEQVVHDDLVWIVAYLLGDEDDDD